MQVRNILAPVILMIGLTGCGYIEADDKQQLERAWLANNEQLQQVIEQIRSQGIEAVAKGAAIGSVAACVANKLESDPLGDLINVEGSLVESEAISDLMNELQELMDQDFSFEQMTSLLQKGADATVYAKQIIADQGVEKGMQYIQQMAESSHEFATQDLGGHFQQILRECQ